jgi:hypothetical protein
MADPGDSMRNKIIVGVVVGLAITLVGGASAPWWVKIVFPAAAQTATSTPVTLGGTTGPFPTFVPPSAGVPSIALPSVTVNVQGCVLTITNPLVSMRESPDISSLESGNVPPGQYAALATTVVKFAGQDQRWFQVRANDRIGWIMYDTILVSSKSADCP